MNSKTVLVVLSLTAAAAAGCDESETKLDACTRLGRAYCDQEKKLGCAVLTSPCPSEGCVNYFDSECTATSGDIDSVDSDIENVILAATTCDALQAQADHLVGTVEDMSAGVCGNLANHVTVGWLCQDIIGRGCDKNIELGCYNFTKPECMELVFATGAIGLGNGYGCSDPDDATTPTSENIKTYNDILEEIANATACEY